MKDFESIASIKAKKNLTSDFLNIANELYSNWIIDTEDRQFEVIECEFVLKTNDDLHADPFIDGAPQQFKMAQWYVPEGGIDITFGCADYAASIFIRSLRDIKTMVEINGPQRCFRALFQDAGHISSPSFNAKMTKRKTTKPVNLWAVPRMNLPVEAHSSNLSQRLNFTFRPYRIVDQSMKDVPDKYLVKLYLEKVANQKCPLPLEGKIFNKYIDAFEMGMNQSKLDSVWNISSRSMRISALMGFMKQTMPTCVV